MKYLSLLLLINFINAQESKQTQPTTPPSSPQNLVPDVWEENGYDAAKDKEGDLKWQAVILPG